MPDFIRLVIHGVDGSTDARAGNGPDNAVHVAPFRLGTVLPGAEELWGQPRSLDRSYFHV